MTFPYFTSNNQITLYMVYGTNKNNETYTFNATSGANGAIQVTMTSPEWWNQCIYNGKVQGLPTLTLSSSNPSETVYLTYTNPDYGFLYAGTQAIGGLTTTFTYETDNTPHVRISTQLTQGGNIPVYGNVPGYMGAVGIQQPITITGIAPNGYPSSFMPTPVAPGTTSAGQDKLTVSIAPYTYNYSNTMMNEGGQITVSGIESWNYNSSHQPISGNMKTFYSGNSQDVGQIINLTFTTQPVPSTILVHHMTLTVLANFMAEIAPQPTYYMAVAVKDIIYWGGSAWYTAQQVIVNGYPSSTNIPSNENVPFAVPIHVQDSATGVPISGASITGFPTTTTDNNGNAVMGLMIHQGQNTISASGYGIQYFPPNGQSNTDFINSFIDWSTGQYTIPTQTIKLVSLASTEKYNITVKVEDSVGNLITDKDWYVWVGGNINTVEKQSILGTGMASFTNIPAGSVITLTDKGNNPMSATQLNVPSTSYVFTIPSQYSAFSVHLSYYDGTNGNPVTFPYSATVTVGSQSKSAQGGTCQFYNVNFGDTISVSASGGYSFPTSRAPNNSSFSTGSIELVANGYPVEGSVSV